MLRVWKSVVFVGLMLPAVWLAYKIGTGDLGANPIKTATHFTGIWALRIVVLTLMVTPFVKITGWKKIMQFRRMIGLFAFFYAALHLLIYVVLDHFFDFGTIATDIIKRPYITIGMGAFLILLALAVTSSKAMVRRLGGRRWQKLHRLVYVAAIAAAVHFAMAVKADLTEPLIYAGIITILLLYRVGLGLKRPNRALI